MANQLDNLAAFIENEFGITIDAERLAGFEAELEGGGGRSKAELRSDILKHIVGDEALTAYVKEQFESRGLTADDSRVSRIVGEFLTEGRQFNEFTATLDDFSTVDEKDVIRPEGKTDGYGGLLAGGTIHKITNEFGQSVYYIVEYEYPPGSGHSFFYKFKDAKTLEQAVGPNLGGGAVSIGEPMDEGLLSEWTDGGDANEIVGIQGSFNGFIDDISRAAGLEAGIDDPSLVGEALKDPAIALIMAKASQADWSKERIKAELRDTKYYKEVLHPGIEFFYGQSSNPEAEYAMYKQNVEASLKSLGVTPDEGGGYGSQLFKLLESGVTDTAFATFATVYKQAQTNVAFAGALSKWTEKYTGIAIASFEDYFDVLAGNSPAEVLEIAEIAGLQYMAENRGFVISDEELKLLSEGTDLDQAQAGNLFSQVARDLLSLGERGLRKGGLTSNQILEAEAGIGGNTEKIRLLMKKLAREEGISDDPTASIFTDFNREGAPIKKGLQANISEGA